MRQQSIQLLEEKFARKLSEEMGKFRSEMYKEIGKLEEKIGKLEVKIEGIKGELVRWMFLFWVGQLALVVGIIFTLVKLMFK